MGAFHILSNRGDQEPLRKQLVPHALPANTSTLPQHHRQLVVARDVKGKPFGFLPLLCRLYSLEEVDLRHDLPAEQHAIIDAYEVPAVAAELKDAVAEHGLESLHRHHTPGIALIVTQSCNLTCSYCLAKQGTFGLDVVKMTIPEVTKTIASLFATKPDIDFIKFFGGEPTLRMDLIEAVCDFVTHKLGKTTHFALTTNGTFPATEHLSLWRQYHVSVSVSIDGPPAIHDAERKRSDGRGSHRDALAYCQTLRDSDFPFAAVGVFDERHIKGGMSYLDMIRYLNQFSPLVKVQFLEALGDAADHVTDHFDLDEARRQVIEAVDHIMTAVTSDFLDVQHPAWVYDNNLFRFLYGIMCETARPYEHACTASNLTTVFPSGDLMSCYTLASFDDAQYGTRTTVPESVEQRRQEFQNTHTWTYLSSCGASVPWYRGIVGDICVADMMNSQSKGLEQSDLYRTFQETATLRILQWLPAVASEPLLLARVLHAIEEHRAITGEYTDKMRKSGNKWHTTERSTTINAQSD